MRPGLDDSPPASGEVENVWSSTSIHPLRLHDVVLTETMNAFSWPGT
jgi:hypothetical protein